MLVPIFNAIGTGGPWIHIRAIQFLAFDFLPASMRFVCTVFSGNPHTARAPIAVRTQSAANLAAKTFQSELLCYTNIAPQSQTTVARRGRKAGQNIISTLFVPRAFREILANTCLNDDWQFKLVRTVQQAQFAQNTTTLLSA
jgi:hypothetical protein